MHHSLVTQTRRAPVTGVSARLAAASLLLIAVVAACGTATPTPPRSTSSTSTGAIGPSGGSVPASGTSVAPNASIVPVPTSQLVAAAAPAVQLDDAMGKALNAALLSGRKSGGYPGMSAAIVFPDGRVWTGVSGTAVLSSGTGVTTDTLFSVGSISKTFVAALVCRLAMDGTIGLDDHLDKYVPTFPNAANITIRQLLNHTSGIQDLFQNLTSAIAANHGKTWTAQEVLDGIGAPWFAPGKGYHYSNTDFILLGMVIESATGQKVSKLVRDDFLTPLGLDHTYLQTEEDPQGPEAHGYMGTAAKPKDNWDGKMLPYTSEVTAVGPAGAYVSTASDIARWANALYSGDVLDEATLASMVDITATLKYKAPYHGLGFEQTTVAGQVAWGHLGNLDGFWSAMEYLPAYHLTVVVITNGGWATKTTITNAATALAKVALGGAG